MSNHVKLIHLSRGNILLFMCLVPQLLSVSHTIILTPARVHLVTYFIFFFSHPSESSTPSGINSVDNSYTPILKVPLAPLVPVLCFPYELDRWPTLCTSCPWYFSATCSLPSAMQIYSELESRSGKLVHMALCRAHWGRRAEQGLPAAVRERGVKVHARDQRLAGTEDECHYVLGNDNISRQESHLSELLGVHVPPFMQI